MRIEVKDEAWRRKPSYDVEECYSSYRGQMSRGIRFILKGPHAVEDSERILKGMVCANCMEPFPARPSKQSLQLFIDSGIRYPQPDWKNLIRQERCPMCRDEVTYEYAAMQFEGMLPKLPGLDQL